MRRMRSERYLASQPACTFHAEEPSAENVAARNMHLTNYSVNKVGLYKLDSAAPELESPWFQP